MSRIQEQILSGAFGEHQEPLARIFEFVAQGEGIGEMRATRIPPKLEQPRTTAGLPVGPRELVIVGPACVLAVLTFFSGLPFFVKVGSGGRPGGIGGGVCHGAA